MSALHVPENLLPDALLRRDAPDANRRRLSNMDSVGRWFKSWARNPLNLEFSWTAA